MSCEYLIKGTPEGQDPEIVVLDVDDKLHEELMKVKEYGIKEFVKLLEDIKKPYTLAHPAWPVNSEGPALTVKEVDGWTDLCRVIETINGDSMRENEIAGIIAKYKNKPSSGGSDDHSGLYIGSAYTVAPYAESKEDFLQHFWRGKISPEGVYGTMERAYLDMIKIGRDFVNSEKIIRKNLGWTEYYHNSPKKFLMMLFMPPVLPFFLRAASIRNKETFERRSSVLEKGYIAHLRDTKDDILEEKIKKMRTEFDDKLDELTSLVKPKSAYIPKRGLFQKFVSWLFDMSCVHTSFDRF